MFLSERDWDGENERSMDEFIVWKSRWLIEKILFRRKNVTNFRRKNYNSKDLWYFDVIISFSNHLTLIYIIILLI